MVARSFDTIPVALLAVAEVTGAGLYTFNHGFTASVTINGVGDKSLTLDNDGTFADTIRYSKATVQGAVPALISVQHQSNTEVQVVTVDELGAAVNVPFSIEVKRLPDPV